MMTMTNSIETTTVGAHELTLHDLEIQFGLQQTNTPQFFLEWQTEICMQYCKVCGKSEQCF